MTPGNHGASRAAPATAGAKKTPRGTTTNPRRSERRYVLPTKNHIGSSIIVFEEFEILLHLTEAVLDIIEVVSVIVGTAEEEAGLSGEQFVGEVVVSKDTLATADEFLHILLIHEGVVLVNHLAEVLEVGEDEVHLAEVGIVLLVGGINLALQFLLQLRQVKNLLRVGVDFPLIVSGDEGAKFLHESEIA